MMRELNNMALAKLLNLRQLSTDSDWIGSTSIENIETIVGGMILIN